MVCFSIHRAHTCGPLVKALSRFSSLLNMAVSARSRHAPSLVELILLNDLAFVFFYSAKKKPSPSSIPLKMEEDVELKDEDGVDGRGVCG